MFGLCTPHTNTLGVHYTKHLSKNLFTAVTHHIISIYTAVSDAPCLSFDVLSDNLGLGREEFPLTCYIVGGTQADRAQANCVITMKLSNLCKTQKNSESDEDSDRFVL